MNKISLLRLSAFLFFVLSSVPIGAQEAVVAPQSPPPPKAAVAAVVAPPAPAPVQSSAPAKAPASAAPAQSPAPADAPAAAIAPPAFALSYGSTGDNFLGVYTEEVTRENMGRFQMREARGVGVTRVVKGSPAERAGLRENDVILRYDGEEVTSIRKLNRLIDESSPEHNARLTVSRNGSEQEINVKLASRADFPAVLGGQIFTPEQAEQWRKQGEEWRKQGEQWKKNNEEWRKQSEQWRKQGQQWREQAEKMLRDNKGAFALAFNSSRRIGVTTSPLTDQLADYFGVEGGRGVLVSSVAQNSPAARAGLKAGDVIVEVDGERVEQSGDISRLINRKKDGEVKLTVVRDRKRRTFNVTPEQSEGPRNGFFMDDMALAPGAITLPRIDINPPRIIMQPLRLQIEPMQMNITPPNINIAPPNINIVPQHLKISPMRINPIRVQRDVLL